MVVRNASLDRITISRGQHRSSSRLLACGKRCNNTVWARFRLGAALTPGLAAVLLSELRNDRAQASPIGKRAALAIETRPCETRTAADTVRSTAILPVPGLSRNAERCKIQRLKTAADIARSMGVMQDLGPSRSVEQCKALQRKIAEGSIPSLGQAVTTVRLERLVAIREPSRNAARCKTLQPKIAADTARSVLRRAMKRREDRRECRNEAIRVATGIALLRALTVNEATPTDMDEEVLARSSTCVSRSCVGLPMETAIRVVVIVGPAMVDPEEFLAMAGHDRATAVGRIVRPVMEVAVVVPRVVEAATSVEAAEDIPAVAEGVIPAAEVVGTQVAEAMVAIAKTKLL